MTRGYEPERVLRVVHRNHRGTLLAAVPVPSRFSDPRARYAMLYVAETVRCTFWETLRRNRFAQRRRQAKGACRRTLRSPACICRGVSERPNRR